MAKITITDDRREVPLGVNGAFFRLPTGTEIDADEGIMSGLRDAGVNFHISGKKDGADNAVSTIAQDPPLTGGPKVVAGDDADEGGTPSFKAGNVSAKTELGEGSSAQSSQSELAAGSDPSKPDFTQDTGGPSAPTPGSRDTIATSAPAPAKKTATKRRSAK